jgi:Flp pilus assembly protein TadB
MPIFFLVLGGCGISFAFFHGARLDALLPALFLKARRQLARLLETAPSPSEDLLLTTRLISALRAGISLDAALESAAQEAAPGAPMRGRIRKILDGNATSDFLSAFLRSALHTGAPVLASLQGIEKALVTKRRLSLRAKAASSQCRAQAEVLSWLPFALGLGIALVDPEWFWKALAHPLSWLVWAMAIALCGLGRRWMKWALAKALRPRGEREAMEENLLPDLTLRVLAEVSQGTDVESACERSLQAIGNPRLSQLYLAAAEAQETDRLARLKSLLRYSARTGAPVREELLSFLADLHNELEARWEERVLRLPVALLAPLFVCFLPGSLLVLLGLLLPLALEVL